MRQQPDFFRGVPANAVSACLALSVALIAAPAAAQSGSDGAPSEKPPTADGDDTSDDDQRLSPFSDGTILVTATRREARTLDLPFSITALSGDELVENDKDDLADFIRQVPGVTFRQQSAGLNQLSIRGVSGGGGQRAKAPISFYIDDVPVVSDPVASPDIKTFDINRVEVLRGPQGTLFGESALGGVIRILTNDPDPTQFEGRVKGSYINFETGGPGYNLDGMINIPLVSDRLALRAVVSRRDEAGWIDNLGIGGRDNANDLDYWSGRAKLLFQASPTLDISASYSFVRSDYGSRQEGNQNFEQFIDFTDENRIDNIDQFNITIKADLGFAELTSSSNNFTRDTSRLFNLNFFNDFLPGLLSGIGAAPEGFVFDEFAQTLDIDDESFVQEIRLVSQSENDFRWVLGGFFYDTDNFVGATFFGTPDLEFNYLNLRRNESYQQRAIFGEAELDIGDRLTLVAGLRYTEEDRTILYDQSDDFPFTVFLPATGNFEVDIKYNILTPRFALQYYANDDMQIYASAARGFRGPGGNTDFDNAGVRNNVYGAETIWTYELGTKARLMGGKLTLEAAVFYTDWNDRQEVVNPEAPFTEQFSDNIGQAEIYGFELSAVARPTPTFTFGGNFSYLSTEIVSSAEPAFVGLPILGEPELRANIFADLDYPISDELNLTAHVDGGIQGEVIYSFANPVEEGDYFLGNASVGVRKGKWAARLFVRNFTNEFIRFGAGQSTSINEPRVFGASLDISF